MFFAETLTHPGVIPGAFPETVREEGF
jgi:hypothetical protein